MFHSAEAYIGRQGTEMLASILRLYTNDEDIMVMTLQELWRRGDSVPADIRKQAQAAWVALKTQCPDIEKAYPELDTLYAEE